MSKLSSRMVGCLRALTSGPRLQTDILDVYTGWSVKALLKRGYIAQAGEDFFITTTGLSALHLEESDASAAVSPQLGGSGTEERTGVEATGGGQTSA